MNTVSPSIRLSADPIKAIGEVTVPLKIHRDVTAQLKVKVVPDTH